MFHCVDLSIIINNFNYGRFLSEAIESALRQDVNGSAEVIVVDDGSTDGSRDIIEKYGTCVRPIFKTNGGQASALNRGFAASRGGIIVFLDADDTLLPTAADTLLSTWSRNVVRTQYLLEVVDACGNSLGRHVGGSTIPNSTLGPFGVASPTSGNAFSRVVLERIMPIPENEWPICADAFLTAASSLFGEVVSLGQALGKYRVHGKNSVAAAPAGIAEIRRAITSDLNLHASLRRLAPDRIGPCEEWLGRYPQHWVNRIGSLRESPADHPWDDRLFKLLRRAVSATWRQPFWNLRRKLVYSLWVVAYGTFPINIARALKQAEERGARSLPQFLVGRGLRTFLNRTRVEY